MLRTGTQIRSGWPRRTTSRGLPGTADLPSVRESKQSFPGIGTPRRLHPDGSAETVQPTCINERFPMATGRYSRACSGACQYSGPRARRPGPPGSTPLSRSLALEVAAVSKPQVTSGRDRRGEGFRPDGGGEVVGQFTTLAIGYAVSSVHRRLCRGRGPEYSQRPIRS